MHKTVMTTLAASLLAISTSVNASGISFGGFSLGGGDPDDGGTAVDIGELFKAGKNAATLLDEVDLQEEIAFGEQASELLLSSSPLLNNPVVQQYVNRIGRWLSLNAERQNLPWRFGVLDSTTVNAYAAPGGYIFITYGLYQKLNSEAELAAVLAHEMAHVIQRHHVRTLKKNAASGLATSLASANSPSMMTREAANGLRDIWNSGLDKDYEYEADLMGMVIATRAGYDPYGMVAVLQMLDTLRPDDDAVALMFKTHPLPSQRLEELEPQLGILDPYAEQPGLATRFQTVR